MIDGRRFGPGALFATLLAAAALVPAAPASAAKAMDKPALPADTAPADPELAFYRQRLALADAMVREDNMAGVDRELSAVIDDPLFDTLVDEAQKQILSTACWAAARQEQAQRARGLCRRATGYADANADDWYRLAMLEALLDEPEAAAAAFTEFVQRWPELLEDVDEAHIHRLRHALPADSPARLAMTQALFDANWKSRYGSDSAIWYDLALARIERGEPERARIALDRVDAPEDLVRVRSDRRFDGLYNRNARRRDVDEALRRQIDALEQRAAISPDLLDPRVRLSYALLQAGRNQEVIDLANRALARIARSSPDRPAFDDIDDQVWLMNNRAIALRRMGRIDEALAQMRRASRLSEDGQMNVSQALNLGDFYCGLQRPDDATGAVEHIGAVSDYGRMVLQKVRHCAALQRNDATAAATALAHVREHEDDAPVILLEVLLRAGLVDEAAARLVARLESRNHRGRMLEWLQDCPLPDPLPGNVGMRAARATLLARDEVTAAVDRVGRIDRCGIILVADLD